MGAYYWGLRRIARIRWLLSSLLAYQNCRFGSFAYLLHLRAFSKPQKYLNIPMLQLHPYLRTMVPLRFQQFSAHRIVDDWTLLGLLLMWTLLKDGGHFSPSSIFLSCPMFICDTPSFVTKEECLFHSPAGRDVNVSHSPLLVNEKLPTFSHQKSL